MIPLDQSYPLTDFTGDASSIRQRLKQTGLPAVLTVDGFPDLVVQDAQAYQKLLAALDRIEAVEGIQDGLKSMKNGTGREPGAFFRDLRQSLGLPAKKTA